MEKSTKILFVTLGSLAIAGFVTVVIIHNSKKKDIENKFNEKKSNIGGPNSGGHQGGRVAGRYPNRVGVTDIYGASYVFPYTPLYGYDQCSYKDKNGVVVTGPCAQSMGWSRYW